MTTETIEKKKKVGDLMCDIGKYMVTVIPFTYFLQQPDDMVYVISATAVVGVLLMIFGIHFVSQSAVNAVSGNARKRKIRLLRNATFTVEEQKQE